MKDNIYSLKIINNLTTEKMKGKIPYQKFLDGKRKYALPLTLINSIILYRKE